MARLTTGRGDGGETGLLYGGRVPKDDPRCAANGTLDEANSHLGMARSLAEDARVRDLVGRVQRELFTVGAELATDPSRYDAFRKHFQPVGPDMVAALELATEELMANVELPRAFVIPGGSSASAALDTARAVVRRAEREVVSLQRQGLVTNAEILRYVNRLSDLLFALARYQDRDRHQAPG